MQSYTRDDNCIHTADYLKKLGLKPGLIRRRNDNSLYILTETKVMWIGYLNDYMAQG